MGPKIAHDIVKIQYPAFGSGDAKVNFVRLVPTGTRIKNNSSQIIGIKIKKWRNISRWLSPSELDCLVLFTEVRHRWSAVASQQMLSGRVVLSKHPISILHYISQGYAPDTLHYVDE